MKVTLHVPPGETITGLRRSLAELQPGAPLRGVSGRSGVLVDADLALAYLLRRAGGDCRMSGEGVYLVTVDGPHPVGPGGTTDDPSPVFTEVDEAPAATETTPASPETPGGPVEAVAVVPKKPAAKKAAKKTVKEG